MLPIPQTYFRTLKTMILKFIWQNKRPRIQFSVLSKDKGQGGLAAPDVKGYYTAVTLAQMIEWTKIKSDKR